MKKQILQSVFGKVAVVLFAVVVSAVSAPSAAQYDILLKGGYVIDPANNINSKMDVAVEKGKIARVGRNITGSEAEKVVDVSGYYVTPGLIDNHVHCFSTFPGRYISVIADHHHFQSGVTTVVDAGTSGALDFPVFKKEIDRSKVRILAFLNIVAHGMNGDYENDHTDFNVKLAVETAKKYPDIIVGLKTAHYRNTNFDEFHGPWTIADSVLAAGRITNLPIMYDLHPASGSGRYPDRSFRDLVLKKLRPGDIYTHCFAYQFPIVLENGKVNPDAIKAKERGVYFDVGHGAGAFTFRRAVPAIKQGFYPYSISTDLHIGNVNGPVVNLANVMSKFLCMGMPLEEVIRCSTMNPAHEINRPDLGALSVGAVADIAVLELHEGEFGYTDIGRGKIIGDKKLKCVLTMFGGEVVYNLSGVSYPLWQNISKDHRYWSKPVPGR
ncbi:MAG: amidohydrolase/deacetylase family metallohydrolase [Candidatus Latescibacteria bacterium]|nr:amidohydrolase/deacetylase family metallohydrolase [Candidatus Latescibacterota bacterium]